MKFRMKLKFSIHFQQAIIERNINIDHLKKVIRNPDESYASFGGRSVARKAVSGKILEVVYIQGATSDTKNEYRIITAYYILNT
ncbi:MAG: hypothetical protein A3C06_03300 [Candidatus Taylorbacteria bacterium RIFCSPHIGHO2_02_FULL_46_13]|uniref:DUF4258 domain-containing protein n=1 Tax=Candidatus Taylorbacteria bacterium RIFCSPHIGHO2_02_FULL_46_13 TaxID=1802312 RepID=A0A1G2MPP4_9BACT|nr:MAG: hypothetical protein A3C06_03300 [Candidatus Taylorbacteria bacterium RIFCSPHIGHO2_02_FULL_46_13]